MAQGLDEFLGRSPGRPAMIAFECAVVTPDISDPGDTIDVRELEGNKMLHRNCRWSPRPDVEGILYPEPGDRALVLISDAGLPWIIEWTPYG